MVGDARIEVDAFLSLLRRVPVLSVILMNQDLMFPLLLFLCTCSNFSSVVGSRRKSSLLEVSLMAHIALAASSRGMIIFRTVCFHLFDFVQGLYDVIGKSNPVPGGDVSYLCRLILTRDVHH